VLPVLGGLVVVVCALGACGFPEDLPADSTTPDPSGVQLEEGSASDGTEARDAGRPMSDAAIGASAKTADAAKTDAIVAPDAAAALQTFTVSTTDSSCSGCNPMGTVVCSAH
jgi:hypothetical protein